VTTSPNNNTNTSSPTAAEPPAHLRPDEANVWLHQYVNRGPERAAKYAASVATRTNKQGEISPERDPYRDGRFMIHATGPIMQQVHESLMDLGARGVLYDEDDRRLVTLGKDGTAFRPSKAVVRGEMQLASAFVKPGGSADEEILRLVLPPSPVVDAVYERGDYSKELHPFRGVRRMPYVGADGHVRGTPGYSIETGISYVGESASVPTCVTREDALREASFLLKEVFGDFPLDDVGRAVVMAAMLSIFGRAATGPSPVYIFDAPVAGSGKTLAAEICCSIGLGEVVRPVAFRSEPVEFAKTLLSKLLLKSGAIVFDNIKGPWGCAELDAMVTSKSGRMMVRLLGQLSSVEVWCQSVVLATGNSVQLTGDQGRRVLWCRLDPQMENPETRTGFRHEDLSAYVLGNLARLHHALVVIWEGYRQAGRPRSDLSPLGSFEGWSRHVRDLVLWLGMADPCASRDLTRERDPDREFLSVLLPAVERLGANVTIAKIVEAAGNPKNADLAGALVEFKTPGGHINARSLGKRLAIFRGRIVDGRRLVSSPRLAHGQRTWTADRVTPSPPTREPS
jgi:putative DNA primase/helicase